MSAMALHSLPYGRQELCFRLARSERTTLAIHVYPDMSVEVVAPHEASLDKIYTKVRKRARWITKQVCFFQQFHPRTMTRQYISGESHRYLGKQYKLKVELNIQAGVKIKGGYILLTTHYPNRTEHTKQLLEKWLYTRAKEKFRERLFHCMSRLPEPELVSPKGLIVRHLSNRWGSMTTAGNLVLNWRLIQASVPCIDYVITHELCHRIYPHHGKEFWNLLSRVFPDWEKYKDKLEIDLS